ncbi:MAG: putative glycolipid-binding domain-containing protein [Nocardiaceae bacterium]|nr:putative glycolipid-binding domain-containing protein [Nocardiaceae bacterium]
MTTPFTAETAVAGDAQWPTILTWRAYDEPRMESARVQIAGRRVRAAGRIVAAQSPLHPAFSASYDLATDDRGIIDRVTLRTTRKSGVKHTSLTRDEEGFWTVITGNSQVRSNFGGAIDIDLSLSPFFSTLTLRRLRSQGVVGEIEVPMLMVNLIDLSLYEAIHVYRIDGDSIQIQTATSTATLTVDADGVVSDYPGLAERV